jgi:cytochrome c oxidase cbb3-type subunit 2
LAQADGGTAAPPAGQKAAQPALDAPPAIVSIPPNAAAKRGYVDYLRYCASCHGNDGDGRGPSAQRFDNGATALSAGFYKCRSTPTGTLPTDDDLRRSIRHGLDGTGMPSFLALGPLQIDDLVETLKHFSVRFAREAAGQSIQVPPEPRDDAASVTRGGQTYARMKCQNCHGWRGEGGPGAANLRNEDGTLAHLTDFAKKRSLKCGESRPRIYTTLMTGLDGSPMSGYAETISPEEAWDLVHYVTSVRK